MSRFRDLFKSFPIACGIGGPRAPRPAKNAPVAQLDRAPDYESGGQEFESLRARHFNPKAQKVTSARETRSNNKDPQTAPHRRPRQFPDGIIVGVVAKANLDANRARTA